MILIDYVLEGEPNKNKTFGRRRIQLKQTSYQKIRFRLNHAMKHGVVGESKNKGLEVMDYKSKREKGSTG